MSDGLICPNHNCLGVVEKANRSRENDYCRFQEAECSECHNLYWIVFLDDNLSLRIREQDDDIDFFDRRLVEALSMAL